MTFWGGSKKIENLDTPLGIVKIFEDVDIRLAFCGRPTLLGGQLGGGQLKIGLHRSWMGYSSPYTSQMSKSYVLISFQNFFSPKVSPFFRRNEDSYNVMFLWKLRAHRKIQNEHFQGK